jgi:hypothetical protein
MGQGTDTLLCEREREREGEKFRNLRRLLVEDIFGEKDLGEHRHG